MPKPQPGRVSASRQLAPPSTTCTSSSIEVLLSYCICVDSSIGAIEPAFPVLVCSTRLPQQILHLQVANTASTSSEAKICDPKHKLRSRSRVVTLRAISYTHQILSATCKPRRSPYIPITSGAKVYQELSVDVSACTCSLSCPTRVAGRVPP